MDYDYGKWSNYTIGDISWINDRKNHLSKIKYQEHIINSSFRNILEIGAGEVIEGQRIRDSREDINYNILDVSDLFLENAKQLGFPTFKGEMYNTPFDDKTFDLVYLSAVLEHSPDIKKTFNELKRISNNFYFTMFKWKMKTGGLKSFYVERRKFFSTLFNINKLLELLSTYGHIDSLVVYTLKGKEIDYKKYRKTLKNIDTHRNGNWLSIIGRFNK